MADIRKCTGFLNVQHQKEDVRNDGSCGETERISEFYSRKSKVVV